MGRFAFGILCIALVLALNSSIQMYDSNYIPMSLFLGSVIVASWCGGFSVGIFVTFLGFVIETFVYSKSPFYVTGDKLEILRVSVYLAQGAALSLVFGSVYKMQKKIVQHEKKMAAALLRKRCEVYVKDATLKDLKVKQSEYVAQRFKAEQASLSKSMFLANMSHEIRTPLVSILGYAELLKDGDITLETAKSYGAIIDRTGNNLLEIINDVLDLSKVEAGQLDIEKIPFCVVTLIEEIHTLVKVKAEEKKLDLIFHENESIPDIIISDPHRIRQILTNLIGNAIKFTDSGSIQVFYNTDQSHITFCVRDTGIGIDQDQQKKLFQNFGQGDSSIARRFSGTGLGLSLSKQLAQKLGGDVFLVETKISFGSTFALKIPFQLPSDNQAVTAYLQNVNLEFDKNFSEKSILLVEDSLDNQFLIKTLLVSSGFTVTVACNGQEAIDFAKKDKFDLVLMDMQMPVKDGYVACQEMLANNFSAPIVALTANAMKEDRDRCLQAGCSDYITKPIRKTQLLQTIRKNLDLV